MIVDCLTKRMGKPRPRRSAGFPSVEGGEREREEGEEDEGEKEEEGDAG